MIGLLGGSFNPAHQGHRHISRMAIKALNLKEIWWMVSPGNPLKDPRSMAPLVKRVKAARKAAKRAPIRVTAIEHDLGTRFTIDTVRKLQERYPKLRFIWLMGADNLAQFHRWKSWRVIALRLPIAVIARPGYNASALASPAGAWFRRFAAQPHKLKMVRWRAPALVTLRFNPDKHSATAIRKADPLWADTYTDTPTRDQVTRRNLRNFPPIIQESNTRL